MTKTLQAGSAEAARYAEEQQAKKKATSLDNVLASISKPNKISTVSKSSKDWDKFKEDQKITEELEQSTKNGYLEKQDFLNRCDSRSFELEKAERDRKRSRGS